VDEFAKLVQSDPKLANGFSAVGLSQGNLVIRGYVEKYNNPPVKTFVSICGPHSGVGACPTLLGEIVCPIWKLAPYSAHLAFSGYWKDVTNEKEYEAKSAWLADMENARDTKNATYKANMVALDKVGC
jgi:palmitoyl-protein thioesterase